MEKKKILKCFQQHCFDQTSNNGVSTHFLAEYKLYMYNYSWFSKKIAKVGMVMVATQIQKLTLAATNNYSPKIN